MCLSRTVISTATLLATLYRGVNLVRVGGFQLFLTAPTSEVLFCSTLLCV